MKKHKGSKEQERYYARKNREMDRFEAHDKSAAYAEKVINESAAKEGINIAEGLDSATDAAIGELREIIQRAWLKGLDKGREQGGLEPLFRGEEA
ncbi:hypothetical protein HZV21_005094 [Salmonella enterica]|nr:hypothetical protein [Salmonella enterica]EJI6541008.1 hypothetical protein [Salmonella enterica]EJK5562022.1 hypothetical protein [Salmonella enterica]